VTVLDLFGAAGWKGVLSFGVVEFRDVGSCKLAYHGSAKWMEAEKNLQLLLGLIRIMV
jgi:hypothetical protein